MKKYKTIKILHVILSLDYGGTEKILVDLVNGLSPKEFEQSIICMDQYGQMVSKVKKKTPIYLMGREPGLSIKNFYSFYKSLKKVKPDIVHFRNFTTYFWGCAVSKFQKNIRIVYSDHSEIVTHYKTNDRKKLLTRRLLKYMTNNFMTNCLSFKEKLIELVHLNPEDVTVIFNGVDTEKYYPIDLLQKRSLRAHFEFSYEDYIIGVVAGLRSKKNVSFAIKAMSTILSKLPQAKLVLVGKGEQEKELKSLVQELGLTGKIFFHGLIKEINNVLNIFDLFLLPSDISEGMPNAVLEAMAAKVPIVGSDIQGIVEILQNGHRGFLFKKNDKYSLTSTINKVAKDKILRDKLIENAYRYVKEDMSCQNMIKCYENFYRSVYNKQLTT